MKNEIKKLGFILLIALFAVSCGKTKKGKDETVAEKLEEALDMKSPQAPEMSAEMKTVVDVALADVKFSTLGKGLKSAELVAPLNEMDSITLFAPTNDGFGKLPEEKVTDLMQPQGKSELIGILKYHAVNGVYDADRLKTELAENNGELQLETLQGTTVKIKEANGKLMLIGDIGDTANIVNPNLRAVKGVVHGIDMVLLPN